MKTRIISTAMVTFALLFLLSITAVAKGKEFKTASSHVHDYKHLPKTEIHASELIAGHEWLHVSDKINALETWMVYPAVFDAGFRAADKTLGLESWMYNAALWEAGLMAADKSLPLEMWMTHVGFWETFTPAHDEKSILEEWMMEENCWVVNAPDLTPAAESKLSLEPWMTDSSFWK